MGKYSHKRMHFHISLPYTLCGVADDHKMVRYFRHAKNANQLQHSFAFEHHIRTKTTKKSAVNIDNPQSVPHLLLRICMRSASVGSSACNHCSMQQKDWAQYYQLSLRCACEYRVMIFSASRALAVQFGRQILLFWVMRIMRQECCLLLECNATPGMDNPQTHTLCAVHWVWFMLTLALA